MTIQRTSVIIRMIIGSVGHSCVCVRYVIIRLYNVIPASAESVIEFLNFS
jgi:hypothetical protein